MPDATTPDRRLRISSTGRALNYLPEYWANDAGLFAEAGITVEATPRDPWFGVVEALQSGDAEMALGGLWVPAMYSKTDLGLVAVGQANARFPMVLLTREKVEDFDWSWLNGKVMMAAGAGGTAPHEFTAGLIREAGVTLKGTRFSRDLPAPMCNDLWRAGLADAYVTDLLTGMTMASEGNGFITVKHTEAGGLMPNSVYYVLRSRLPELQDRISRFLSVMEHAMTTLNEGGPEVADALVTAERFWPNTPVLKDTVAELSRSGVWATSIIDDDAAARWLRILDEAGLITGTTTTSDYIDQSARQTTSG